MQERLYTDAPVIAIYYPNDLEGYRKDRITSITPIPEDKGILYGGSSDWPSTPWTQWPRPARSAGGGGGSNTGLIAGVVGDRRGPRPGRLLPDQAA